MDITFMLELNVSKKVEQRAIALMEVDYLLVAHPQIDGFLLRCVRPLDGHQLPSTICACDNLSVGAEHVINTAYDILYGEENDADV